MQEIGLVQPEHVAVDALAQIRGDALAQPIDEIGAAAARQRQHARHRESQAEVGGQRGAALAGEAVVDHQPGGRAHGERRARGKQQEEEGARGEARVSAHEEAERG